MKAELLKILRDTDGYVSGQQLCRHFNVSRTSVWKTICQLREEGYLIEAVQNRGYRLQESPELMSGAEVRSRLHTRWMGRECICLETVDSTNTYARRLAEEGAADGTLVLAEEQTGGKGRWGRNIPLPVPGSPAPPRRPAGHTPRRPLSAAGAAGLPAALFSSAAPQTVP